MSMNRTLITSTLTVGLLGLAFQATAAQGGMAGMDMSGHQHHMEMMKESKSKSALVKTVKVALPQVQVVRQDGAKVDFPTELGTDKPVVLAFIYTTCTTICPVTSQILSRAQSMFGPDIEKVKIISVSIDPDFDTPEKLVEYSRKYGATPSWQHYTGKLGDIIAIEKAFSAYRGDKMNHIPLFFVAGKDKSQWTRFDGFPPPMDLVMEARKLGL